MKERPISLWHKFRPKPSSLKSRLMPQLSQDSSSSSVSPLLSPPISPLSSSDAPFISSNQKEGSFSPLSYFRKNGKFKINNVPFFGDKKKDVEALRQHKGTWINSPYFAEPDSDEDKELEGVVESYNNLKKDMFNAPPAQKQMFDILANAVKKPLAGINYYTDKNLLAKKEDPNYKSELGSLEFNQLGHYNEDDRTLNIRAQDDQNPMRLMNHEGIHGLYYLKPSLIPHSRLDFKSKPDLKNRPLVKKIQSRLDPSKEFSSVYSPSALDKKWVFNELAAFGAENIDLPSKTSKKMPQANEASADILQNVSNNLQRYGNKYALPMGEMQNAFDNKINQLRPKVLSSSDSEHYSDDSDWKSPNQSLTPRSTPEARAQLLESSGNPRPQHLPPQFARGGRVKNPKSRNNFDLERALEILEFLRQRA